MRVIAGKARGTVLKAPEGMQTRPTADRVKEAMFSIIQFDLPGAKVLDLFGGTGQLGIEALSRGAGSAVFVDHSDSACRLIKGNLSKAKLDSCAKIIKNDYANYLQTTTETFDIILLDPPYAEVFLEKCLNLISEIDILHSGGIIVCERPLGKDLSLELNRLVRSKDYKYGNTLVTVYRKSKL